MRQMQVADQQTLSIDFVTITIVESQPLTALFRLTIVPVCSLAFDAHQKRGWEEAGFCWQEPEEIGKNVETLRNIL